MIPFTGNKLSKLFLVSFSYRLCCVSVMWPSGYFISPRLAIGAIWIWDLRLKQCQLRCWNAVCRNSTWKSFATYRNSLHQIAIIYCTCA